jgi:hypothetical protein
VSSTRPESASRRSASRSTASLDVREHDRLVEPQPEEQPLAGRRRRVDRLDLARRLAPRRERCT